MYRRVSKLTACGKCIKHPLVETTSFRYHLPEGIAGEAETGPYAGDSRLPTSPFPFPWVPQQILADSVNLRVQASQFIDKVGVILQAKIYYPARASGKVQVHPRPKSLLFEIATKRSQ